jgi:hypothetical protein
MKRLSLSLAIAGLAVLALVAAAAAASPSPSVTGDQDQVRDRSTIPTILGLTQAEIRELRQDGLTLAQIAERQDVDPQKLIDALTARWSARIDARVENGALTAAEAATLKTQLAVRAKAMVYQAVPGGMGGAAVGAGRGAMDGAGMGHGANAGGGMGPGAGYGGNGNAGNGSGTCDGTGPHGPGAR